MSTTPLSVAFAGVPRPAGPVFGGEWIRLLAAAMVASECSRRLVAALDAPSATRLVPCVWLARMSVYAHGLGGARVTLPLGAAGEVVVEELALVDDDAAHDPADPLEVVFRFRLRVSRRPP